MSQGSLWTDRGAHSAKASQLRTLPLSVTIKVTRTYGLLADNETTSWIAPAGPEQFLRDLSSSKLKRWAVTGSFASSRLVTVAAPEIAVVVRSLLRRAVEATTPQIAIHGHWHHGYESEMGWIDRIKSDRTGDLVWRSTRAVGLGCDGDAASGWFVLDLPSLEVTWPPLTPVDNTG